jgi:hypothetical protein
MLGIKSQSNKIMQKLNKEEHNTNRDTDICGSPNMGYLHREIVSPSFIIIQQMKGYNLQHSHCNFLFLLSQSPMLEYNILSHPTLQYNALIQKDGFPSWAKTLT